MKVSKLSGYVTSGHGRILAARLNGWTQVPVNYQDYETFDQEYADVQADNSIASWAELDLSGINSDIKDLGPDFDLDLLGIKDFFLDVTDLPPGEDDENIEPPVEPKSKLGDLWTLGNHRLLCGDSTMIDAVDRLMDGKKADIAFTSPPYNLGNNAVLRGYNGDGKDTIYSEKSDHKTQQEYLQFLIDFTILSIKFSKHSFVNIQILAGNKLCFPEYWMKFKDNLIDVMIWDKEHAAPQMAARVLNSVFEFIFIFSEENQPSRAIKTGPDFRGNIDNIFRMNPVGKKDPLAKGHGGVFPVDFAKHFIDHFSKDSVLDLFGGSGSTLIACEQTKRHCYMMELDPKYIDVILNRWSKLTGKDPVRDDGVKWSELNG